MEETILTKLHSEHKEIGHGLDLILRTENESVKQELFRQVKEKLVQHMQGEDLSIYRHFREVIPDGHNLHFVLTNDSEHHLIKEYLQRLTLLDVKSERWKESLEELARIIKSHAEDEEDEMFTEAREGFSKDELIQIGTEFEEMKSRSL